MIASAPAFAALVLSAMMKCHLYPGDRRPLVVLDAALLGRVDLI